MAQALIVENLVKEFGSVKAVTGASFEVAENEIFALIGPNGAGKSTILKMIATILQPTSGTATINGKDIVRDSQEVRKQISYLPEEAGAYKNLSGQAYLNFMAGLYADSESKAAEYVEIGRRISGLGPRLSDKVKTYSKGMARKLLLARTVMVKPKLAILDEPTSGLDVINALEIRNSIRELAKSGMTVLLSSHNMLEIEYLAGRVGIIHKGQIREIGTVTELTQKYSARNLEEVFASISV
jgi:ABC-2 type transport system ATP-binding protein